MVVVTGATSGIGRALAARLAARGDVVVGVGRDAQRLAERAAAHGDAWLPLRADLADPADRGRCVQALRARFPRVDALVNNAAECVYEEPTGLAPEAWRRLLEVNLLAAVELTSALLPLLPADGHVVNVSSVTARFLPSSRFAPYALTKAALEAFTQSLRLETRGSPRVTLVAPGLVETPLYDKVPGFAATRARLAEQVPAWLAADDVADAILWVLDRPAHVAVSELVLMPRGQAR